MPKRPAMKKSESASPTTSASTPAFPTPALSSDSIASSYRIGRGEQGVLTFEPYKSILLPHWRFKTVPIAKQSSKTLASAFDQYVSAGDFVGADMSRKFIQMGMTRAKRYANHAGGRKYDRSARDVELNGGSRVELAKSKEHKGREEKLEASEVFREVWQRVMNDPDYLNLKHDFTEQQKNKSNAADRTSATQKVVKKESEDNE